MSRIAAIDPARAEGRTRELLGDVQKLLGATPNLFRVAANAPAALEALVALFGATGRGTLRAREREAIALAVAEANGCDYCLSAHSVLGAGAGLTEGDIAAARDGSAADPRTSAMLRFARELVVRRGNVDPAGLGTLRAAGVSDGEILEVVANVALNVFTNYVNLVADTEIDFPIVRSGSAI